LRPVTLFPALSSGGGGVPETLPQTVMTILPNETIRLSRRGNRFANDLPGAFSSEVETGSRQENASNQESRARFDSIETEKALGTTIPVRERIRAAALGQGAAS
jgi:hypothetical protein